MKQMLAESKRMIKDIAAAVAYVWQGAPLDPKRFATTPPDWWNKKMERPESEPIKKKTKERPNAREFWGSEMLAECYEMSENEWRAKYGQYMVIRWNKKIRAENNHRFADRDEMITWLEQEMSANEKEREANEINFDGELATELTRREYGELKSYKKHKLDNYELAAKVKLMKSQGHKLQVIAEKTKEEYWLIKHYSSALKKAEN